MCVCVCVHECDHSIALLPMVEMNVELKASSENLTRIHVLPTPLSPINSNLNRKSYVFAMSEREREKDRVLKSFRFSNTKSR